MKVLLATNNPGKVREYKELLSAQQAPTTPPTSRPPSTLQLFTPSDLGIDISAQETGNTFEENAIIKATAYAAASGLPAIADDSGLEIDALGGEPGVRSSRYAGPTDADRIQTVLAKLEHVPLHQRTARFRCVVALATPDGKVWTSHGSCEGKISFVPKGRQGFGYDPIFYIPSLKRTMAQIPRSLKNQISHRAIAVRGIRPLLANLQDRSNDT